MDRRADAHRDLDAGLTAATGEMRTNDFHSWAGAARATIALVFTDIVGSTALANRLGNEAMDEVRGQHFQQGRRLVRAFGGYEIKTIGDSLMVTFRTAVEALDFVLAFEQDAGHPR
jgi:class 3 adenylate cyclase